MLRNISKLTGIGVQLRACGLEQAVVRWYAKRYQLNMEEAEFPLAHYQTLQQLFTRRLKAGARCAASELIAPVDGVLRNYGTVEQGQVLQIKGRVYSIADLLKSDTEAAECEGGAYYNFYLSPRDYHRVHAPLDAEIVSMRHIPGKLWPVNRWALGTIHGLFAVNERVVVKMRTALGMVYLVMVGALNVGKIALQFDSLQTNCGWAPWALPPITEREYSPPIRMSCCDELGMFLLGSAVVLILAGHTLKTRGDEVNRQIVLGTSLTEL